MTAWHSLFIPSTDQPAVVQALQAALVELGYRPFNPFGLVPGKAYPRAVRLFVSPPRAGWVRVIGQPDERLLPRLSQLAPCLLVWLDGAEGDVQLYTDGQPADPEALVEFLRPGRTEDDLKNALGRPTVSAATTEPLPLDALPDDVKALARGVDMKHARRLFARLSGTTARRSGASEDVARQAQALIAAGSPPDWQSGSGRWLIEVLACLSIPDGWQRPDFTTLRDAYQVRARLQQRPNASLYPGDAEALEAVPDALDYTPVYAGAEAQA